jgi:hypothetical protein
MKAITILQPHASLIAVGEKRYETRNWPTKYRGPIAIHAGQRPMPIIGGYTGDTFLYALFDAFGEHHRYDTESEADCISRITEQLPYGKIVAVAELVGCAQIATEHGIPKIYRSWLPLPESGATGADPAWYSPANEGYEWLFGDWTPKHYAWELSNVCALPEPLPCWGRQGLWTVPPEIETEIGRELLWVT